MSPDRFPERIDPQRIFGQNGSISSEIPLGSFTRLQDYLSDGSGTVKVRLDFGMDESGRRQITGNLSSRVCLQCQRCLENMFMDVEADLRVLVMSTEEQARALPSDTEAIVPGEEGLDLLALVEDELILSLPIVPYHEDVKCNENLNRLQQPRRDSGEDSPFAKLKELKFGKAIDTAAKGEPRNPKDSD